MIRVTVELVPYGHEAEARKIGEMVISNKANVGNGLYRYDAAYCTDMTELQAINSVVHEREDGIWHLIRRVLESDVDEKYDLHTERLIRRVKMRRINGEEDTGCGSTKQGGVQQDT